MRRSPSSSPSRRHSPLSPLSPLSFAASPTPSSSSSSTNVYVMLFVSACLVFYSVVVAAEDPAASVTPRFPTTARGRTNTAQHSPWQKRREEERERRFMSAASSGSSTSNSDGLRGNQQQSQRSQQQSQQQPHQNQRQAIVDGTPTSRNRFPYMASLQIEGLLPDDTTYDFPICGATLIAPDVLLSAAHCAYFTDPTNGVTHQAFNGIELGHYDLSREDGGIIGDEKKYEDVLPETLVLHPQYDEQTLDHDYLLIKLYGSSQFPPVRLNRDPYFPGPMNGVPLTVLGWGDSHPDPAIDEYTDKLHEAELTYLPNAACEAVEGTADIDGIPTETSLDGAIFDSMMCADHVSRDICFGDSGGPLILKGASSDMDVQVGITSWGMGCANLDFPSVFASVAHSIDWITDQVCELSDDPPAEFQCGAPDYGHLSPYGLSGSMVTVTIKLKLDMQSHETGYVLESVPDGYDVMYRPIGYYEDNPNDQLTETFDIENDRRYRLTVLDSYGDGFCCSFGGGSVWVYLGTDSSYYTGIELAQIFGGSFDHARSIEFTVGNPPTLSPSPTMASEPIPTSSPTKEPTSVPTSAPSGAPSSSVMPSMGPTISSSPSMSPTMSPTNAPTKGSEYTYYCGANYTAASTSCALECPTGSSDECPAGQLCWVTNTCGDDVNGIQPTSDHYVTVLFYFDGKPQEVSWVLYNIEDRLALQYKEFGYYPQADFANGIEGQYYDVYGPERGEQVYAFTVYDSGGDGLCCAFGNGKYEVYWGSPYTGLLLTSGSNYTTASSTTFTVYPGLEAEPGYGPTDPPTSAPTDVPTEFPTKMPTVSPTVTPTTTMPTLNPTAAPTVAPTTANPTDSPIQAPTSTYTQFDAGGSSTTQPPVPPQTVTPPSAWGGYNGASSLRAAARGSSNVLVVASLAVGLVVHAGLVL